MTSILSSSTQVYCDFPGWMQRPGIHRAPTALPGIVQWFIGSGMSVSGDRISVLITIPVIESGIKFRILNLNPDAAVYQPCGLGQVT